MQLTQWYTKVSAWTYGQVWLSARESFSLPAFERPSRAKIFEPLLAAQGIGILTSQKSMTGLVTCFEALGLNKIRMCLQLSCLGVGRLLASGRNI